MIKDDAILKGALHGILLGFLVPVVGYNISVKKWVNVALYGTVILNEIMCIANHMKEAHR